jgi:hypothetical protein
MVTLFSFRIDFISYTNGSFVFIIIIIIITIIIIIIIIIIRFIVLV